VCAPLVVVHIQLVGKIDSLMRLYRHRTTLPGALALLWISRNDME